MMRVVSWNIQWFRGADGRVDPGRTIDAMRALGDVDVFCLQEVACGFPGLKGGQGEDGVALLRAAFPDWTAAFVAALDVPTGASGRASFGNMVLARHPLGQILRHQLPGPADPAVPAMARACLEVVVQAPRGSLRILTTHLEYYSSLQRRAQVARLCEIQREAVGQALAPAASKETNPSFRLWPRPATAVLCGDFNCEPGSTEYRALLASADPPEAQWVDAWSALEPRLPHAPTVGLHGAEWPDRPYCCDYAFVSPDLVSRLRSMRVEADTAASDHQPVVLEIAD